MEEDITQLGKLHMPFSLFKAAKSTLYIQEIKKHDILLYVGTSPTVPYTDQKTKRKPKGLQLRKRAEFPPQYLSSIESLKVSETCRQASEHYQFCLKNNLIDAIK
ncbi:unnamed protein product [Ilex paraguariensis]|uniref:Uncharacterized protein n=1 Tax=Ilex paraguariensis TaxID=185542 RepID=A0ABC8R150_9AQUA